MLDWPFVSCCLIVFDMICVATQLCVLEAAVQRVDCKQSGSAPVSVIISSSSSHHHHRHFITIIIVVVV